MPQVLVHEFHCGSTILAIKGKFGSFQQCRPVRWYLFDECRRFRKTPLTAAQLCQTGQRIAFHRGPAGG